MPYRFTAEAAGDLRNILAEGILTFGEHQARKYQESLHRVLDLLGELPALGRRSERSASGEHRFLHRSHVIYYRIDATGIVVQRVIHSASIDDVWGDL